MEIYLSFADLNWQSHNKSLNSLHFYLILTVFKMRLHSVTANMLNMPGLASRSKYISKLIKSMSNLGHHKYVWLTEQGLNYGATLKPE